MGEQRFEIRWLHGQWIIFDTHQYKPVRFAGTRKEIDRIYATGR